MFDRAQAPFTASASFLMALQPLLVAHSKNAAGGFDYSVPSSVMVSEGLKLVISSALLCSQLVSGKVGRLLHEDAALEFFSYVLPALIYFVNNNCVFFILQAVDPTTFQLLSQMKTIFTGLLFRVFLKRRLTVVQYLALATLACGTACSQLPGPDAACQGGSRHSSLLGLALSVLSALLSALGGIYSEKLLKGRASASIHWQNIQLYVWGVAFNLLGVWLKDAAPLREHGLLAGYDGRAGPSCCTRSTASNSVLICRQHRARVRARDRDGAHDARRRPDARQAALAAAHPRRRHGRGVDAPVQPAAAPPPRPRRA